ncbi:MAG: aminotransferase class V-fold PLP-dependent enzyme, partial [Deltaproteobacteria bacterium]|nr:aminotransferase class V-fold PLP-dependent enzyme [Deltaproteobacteria bacterium]
AILARAAALEDAQQRLAGYRRLLDAATGRLWDGLQAVDGLRSLGRPPGAGTRTGVIACRTLVGSPEADWMPWLRRMGIIARGGLHCAPVQHEQLGLLPAGTLRFSVSRFTSATEIDVALVALAEISARLQREGASAAGRPAVDADAPAPLPAPLPAAAAPPRSELLAFQPGPGGVELIVRQVVPCAEGEGEELLQLEGSWRGAELETLAAALAALGWQVTRLPSRLMLTASWQGARLILAANGEYSLSRIRDREAALAMLTAVARRCSALPAGQARGDAG